uniref:Uncharacterized protein n=1 Tax=Caenorhabditis japonica TaxID=281687 RepID=A0A8R1I665_CAEJA
MKICVPHTCKGAGLILRYYAFALPIRPSAYMSALAIFSLPSASPLRHTHHQQQHRHLFTRQISHRHHTRLLRPRFRSSLNTTRSHSHSNPPTLLQSHRLTPSKRVRTAKKRQRTKLIANVSSRRQGAPPPPRQPRPVFVQQQQRRVPFVARTVQTAQVPRNRQFTPRAPLSPMPFGAVQQSRRVLRPANTPLALRPPPPPPRTTTIPPTTKIMTTPPIPPPIHSVGGSLRRPIVVEQLNLNVRRKPQLTRGQFRRRPHHPHPDRVSTSASTESTTTVIITKSPGIEIENEKELQKVNHLKQVDDIEAAILAAVIGEKRL